MMCFLYLSFVIIWETVTDRRNPKTVEINLLYKDIRMSRGIAKC